MQQLFQNIFGREESFAGDEAFREKLKNEFPYFGPAHFFALKNTPHDDPAFKERAAKAALFFNDLFYLNRQLNGAPNLQSSIFNLQSSTSTTDLQPTGEPLFEPLHATDYFASQGIKLSEDVPADDKLGRQLKSFTAWLKTMKKVHPENTPVEAAGEIAVQTQAEKSNVEEEVVTEAMAEAYVQQGKQGKAIDIYSKLSLQNPSKSAYFAAKIESLKQ